MPMIDNLLVFLRREKIVDILIIVLIVEIILNPEIMPSIFVNIDLKALSLIIFYIILSRSFIISGFIDNIALKMISLSGSTRRLYLMVLAMTFTTAMIATNDGAVLIVLPLALSISRILGLDYRRITVLVLLSANTGSMVLPISNPQNIIIWQRYGLSFIEFLNVSLIAVSLLVSILVLLAFFSGSTRGSIATSALMPPRVKTRRDLAFSSIILLFLGFVFGEYGLAIYALFIEIVVFILVDYRVFLGVDYGLIVLFILLYPVFNGATILIGGGGFGSMRGLELYFTAIVLSQFVSNVPATIILSMYTCDWKTLFIGVNVAGYVSPIGSLANLIGLRISGMKCIEYLKYSLIYTILSASIGALLVYIL